MAFPQKRNRARRRTTWCEVGQNQILVIAKVFFNLNHVLLGNGIFSPEGIRTIALKEGFEFQRQRVTEALRHHEIHEAFHETDLSRGLKPEHVPPKCGEQVFGGGFGFRTVLQIQRVFVNGRVVGNWFGVRRQRKKFDPLAVGKLFQVLEYIFRVHWWCFGWQDCRRDAPQFKNRLPPSSREMA